MDESTQSQLAEIRTILVANTRAISRIEGKLEVHSDIPEDARPGGLTSTEIDALFIGAAGG